MGGKRKGRIAKEYKDVLLFLVPFVFFVLFVILVLLYSSSSYWSSFLADVAIELSAGSNQPAISPFRYPVVWVFT